MKRSISVPGTMTLALALGALLLGGCHRPNEDETAAFVLPGPEEPQPSLVRRAHRLWKTSSQQATGRAALKFMTALAEKLSDDAWWAVSAPVFAAWKRLRSQPELQDDVSACTAALVPRFASSGCRDELLDLARISRSGSFDAREISDALSRQASRPLSSNVFAGTPQEAIVLAMFQEGNPAGANEILGKLDSASLSADARAPLERLRVCLNLCIASPPSVPVPLRSILQAWREARPEPSIRGALVGALDSLVLSAVPDEEPATGGRRLAEWIAEVAHEEGASEFWSSFFLRTRAKPLNLHCPAAKVVRLARILQALGTRAGRPGLVETFWLPRGSPTPEEACRFSERFLELSEEAVEQDQIDLAMSAAASANILARRSDESSLPLRIRRYSEFLSGIKIRNHEAQRAREKLARAPEDSAANFTVGQYLCSFAGAWAQGLPFLLRSNEPSLSRIASRDIVDPALPEDEIALAKEWKSLANAQGSLLYDQATDRAAYWFERAWKRSTETQKVEIAEALRSLPAGRRLVDLLSRVDLGQDTVYGGWIRGSRGVLSDTGSFCRFRFPFQPPLEYDFRASFTRVRGSGDVVFILLYRGKPFAWVVSDSGSSCRHWASITGGWDSGNNPTRAYLPNLLENDRPSTFTAEVRRDRVRASLDGRVLGSWDPSMGDLELPEWLGLQDPRLLGVATFKSPTWITHVDLYQVGTRGVPTR